MTTSSIASRSDGTEGPFDAAAALRSSLAHQNPLHVVDLPLDQNGPIGQPTGRLLITDSGDVIVTAFKPAEDPGQGFVARVWELSGSDSLINLDVSISDRSTCVDDVAHRNRPI